MTNGKIKIISKFSELNSQEIENFKIICLLTIKLKNDQNCLKFVLRLQISYSNNMAKLKLNGIIITKVILIFEIVFLFIGKYVLELVLKF